MTSDRPAAVSAGRLAELLGDQLPRAADMPEEAFELVERIRDLMDAAVLTDAPPAERQLAAARIAEVTAELRRPQRHEHLLLVRHKDGRIESLTQAGSGRLNPQAPDIEWVHRPTEPPPGSEPRAVEVTARFTFGVRHGGSPGRVHGSVLAGALDEVTGIAIRAAGAAGMTVQLDVSLRGAAPLGVPVHLAARFTGRDGRKSYATGEATVAGVVVATAKVIYVAERG